MARRERNLGPCPICSCDLITASQSTTHNICGQCGSNCQGKAQTARFDARSSTAPPAWTDSQNITDLGPKPVMFNIADPAPLPPCREPQGRAWNDTRNNPRFNKARQDAAPEMRDLAPFRSAIYDLETTDLNAQIGRLLCGVILLFDPLELYVFRADQYEAWNKGKRSDDREICGDILSVLEMADIHFAHNGRWFDAPFLSTRGITHEFKPVTPQKLVDPCQIARQKFRLASNSLDSVADHLKIPVKKTPFESNVWATAFLDGDKDAMDYIVDHCVRDVYVLAHVARRISPWVKQIDMIGSFRG